MEKEVIIKDSGVSILDQAPGIVGMKKHIERAARISYRSEGKITEDSYIKFIEMLRSRGHWAAFNLGTVYLKIPKSMIEDYPKIEEFFNALSDFNDKRMSWNRINMHEEVYYVTTNYRVICQLQCEEMMELLWSEPCEFHYHRITSRWICSRVIAQQILRHRVFSPLMESTRYINYGLSKFSEFMSFILPQWVYRFRDKLIESDRVKYGYLFDMSGQDLWDELKNYSELIRRRDALYKMMIEEYIYETSQDTQIKLNPEDARDVFGLGFKTEFYLCGYVEDYCYIPEEGSPEKSGFFFLRTAKDAQSDVRVLAIELERLFKDRGIDTLL